MTDTELPLSPLEKYLRGEPLNPELAELRRGIDEGFNPAAAGQQMAARMPLDDLERELTRGERLALKEIRAHGGWQVLLRLLEKASAIHRAGAINLSQVDPLANGQRIAEEWAYLGAFNRAVSEMKMLVDAEMKALDGERQ